MAFAKGNTIFPAPNIFYRNFNENYFPEKPFLPLNPEFSAVRSVIGPEPLRCPTSEISAVRSVIVQDPLRCTKSEIPAIRSDTWQETGHTEPLHIFVLGPSPCGKRRLIECAANRCLGIPELESMFLAYKISGYLLQGVEVEINLWHVGNIAYSLGILQDFYRMYKTCLMLVYDVNNSATFADVRLWIPNLRHALGEHIPIVLVGYEDNEVALAPKLTPISYADGMKTKSEFELKTYYEFSNMTGAAVVEMVFDAAHIALESKVTTPNGELVVTNENSSTQYHLF